MVRVTYLSIIVLWSTTPLAVKWSIESGVLLGLMARMSIGLFVLACVFMLLRETLTLNKDAIVAYVAAGLGIYFAMSLVYWGAQYIPSGWISVIFGLSPIITGVTSVIILGENHFTMNKTLGMMLGLSGLFVIFYTSAAIDVNVLFGVFAMLLSTVAHAVSAVALKKIDAPITGTQSTLGGLLIAVPLIGITYLFSAEEVSEFTPRSAVSIIYLGAIATAAGFSMYYFILKQLDAVKVSLITLISPVCALLLGALLNDEPITASIVQGGGLILSGLALFELPVKQMKEAS